MIEGSSFDEAINQTIENLFELLEHPDEQVRLQAAEMILDLLP